MTKPATPKPVMPNAATLPLPREWLAFLAALLAYTGDLETRLAALENAS